MDHPAVATGVADGRGPGQERRSPTVVLRLFASARQAAGTSRAEVEGRTVAAVLDRAVADYGPAFADVLATSRVWRNGEPTDGDVAVADGDEIAVLPPVSGG